jgi:methionine synthase II (cobalamin-independent)
VQLIKNAGLGGLAVDLDQLQVADWDAIGAAMSEGMWLGAGALSTSQGPATGRSWSPDAIGDRVLRALRTLGLEPEVASRMVLSPACGLARFDQRSAVNALRTLRKAADIVTDQLPR